MEMVLKLRIVEFVDQNKAVVVRVGCLEGKEIVPYIRLRSELIQTILKIKEEFLPKVDVQEYLIHPHELENLPNFVKDLHCFSLHKLATALVEQKFTISSQRGTEIKPVDTVKLLYFEPYFCNTFIHPDTELFNDECTEVILSQEFLNRIEANTVPQSYATCFIDMFICELKRNEKPIVATHKTFESISNGNSAHQCFQILACWKRHTAKPTYGALKSLLNKYSIFCGKDPLVS